ncbi:MAG: hypothetical protein ABI171_16715 [Collimonas sp.]|uniref:hypothetical protein n=1 Tax=Collimonas sp. TaxID=1963772 RepID=UPI003265C22B
MKENAKVTPLLLAFAQLSGSQRTSFIRDMNHFIFASTPGKRKMIEEWRTGNCGPEENQVQAAQHAVQIPLTKN